MIKSQPTKISFIGIDNSRWEKGDDDDDYV